MKFKVGDTIRNKTTGREYTIGVVSDVMYWFIGHGGVPVGNAESSYELVEQPGFHSTAFEHDFSLSDYKNMWDKHISQMITEITKNNMQTFVGMIDDTLRFLDCDAVRDDVRLGYRQFADELKKRLLCNDIITD